MTLGHLDKNDQNDLNMTLFRGLVFPEIVYFLGKINGNTGGTGLKKRSLSPHLQEKIFFDVDRWIRVEKLV